MEVPDVYRETLQVLVLIGLVQLMAEVRLGMAVLVRPYRHIYTSQQ